MTSLSLAAQLSAVSPLTRNNGKHAADTDSLSILTVAELRYLHVQGHLEREIGPVRAEKVSRVSHSVPKQCLEISAV